MSEESHEERIAKLEVEIARLEGRVARVESAIRRMGKGERGFAALGTVLLLMVVGSIIIVPLLGYVSMGVKASRISTRSMQRFYAADAGVEQGRWQVVYGGLPWDLEEGDRYEYELPVPINDCVVTVGIMPKIEDKTYWLDSEARDTQGRNTEIRAVLELGDNTTWLSSFVIVRP